MKTLLVLTALAAVAVAGPTFRGDTDFDATKEKRSPSLGLHHQTYSHIVPVVHQSYVQPIIPHHLGLKKPHFVHQPYGHHIYRSEEQLETQAESKESKKTCMKEMEAKCDDEINAKSSESDGATKVENIDGNISDTEVAQSLRMAKEAVDSLQTKMQLAEKKKWHHGQSEADGSMHENVQTAKLALEHMQRNFGNLESMNVHARTIMNDEVHDANLKLVSARSSDADKLESTGTAMKNKADIKSDEERLAQWKGAIENIQKNVELVRNIEDSFQHKELSEKSADLEKSSSLKHEISDDHKQEAVMLKDSKNEMETSASTLSESKTTLHGANKQKAFRSESSKLEKTSDVASGSNIKFIAENARQAGEGKVIIKPKELISQPSLKSSGTLMKSAEHHEAEQHKEIEHHSSNGPSSNMGHDMSSHHDHQKSSSSPLQAKAALDKTLNIELDKAKESKVLHAWAMKSSDQMVGQSQPIGVAAKPVALAASGLHSDKLHPSVLLGAHGKSVEDGGLFAPMEINSGFKEALVPTKAWKEAHGSSRGAYGSGAAIGGISGSYGSGYSGGSGAVGVFPSAHVSDCAIPLLMSCSPNVVAGHLSKSHSYAAPSYGASAYRGSESLSSQSKRDITKISRPSKIKKTPTNKGLKQKHILIADKL